MRCKPGVLAFIVRDPFPENIGRVVRVVSPAEPILAALPGLSRQTVLRFEY
ncbi:hypothetical protein ACTMU2_29150 [Cupriavidus basilensis]